ncbi:MAG: glycosyltransferase N-terminal domain-containing protein [Flavobacteriales bacterium]
MSLSWRAWSVPGAWLTDLGTRGWALGVRLAAPFHPKAKAAINGRKGLWQRLEARRDQLQGCIWMHSASVGEFEQGLPVLEAIKAQHPDVPVLLTFFSPSGYEARKQHPIADHVEYLPWDTRGNAERLCALIKPRVVLWVRYEFWYHHLTTLHDQGIPTFLLSATFRPEQPFFRWYGAAWRRMLGCFERIFVQDAGSQQLLGQMGVQGVIQTGDTRFDRVLRIANSGGTIPMAQAFHRAYDAPLLIAGSTWPADEGLLAEALRTLRKPPRLLLVPHEPTEANVQRCMLGMPPPVARWTEVARLLEPGAAHPSGPNDDDPLFARTLVMDITGLLARAYQHADMAYVGGGFSGGIHSVLEAAAWGVPVIFGPDHHKFHEAQGLVDADAAVVIRNAEELARVLNNWVERPQERQLAGMAARQYVQRMAGATERTTPAILSVM